MKCNMASSLHRGAFLVYRHGLLRKGLGLCHGVAGSVYALLTAADVSNEIRIRVGGESARHLDYLAAAIHLSVLATQVDELVEQGKMRTPDRPWSLYEGKAGMCCAWAEVLYKMQAGETIGSGMIGYSDISIEP